MERNLEIKLIKENVKSFRVEIYEPESDIFTYFTYDYDCSATEKFNEEIGNEIYSWVSLLMDAEEGE